MRDAPRSASILDRWIIDLAETDGIAPERLRKWIAYMVVAAMLREATDDQGAPVFVLKGGAALELRLNVSARASADFDTSFRNAMEGMDPVFGTALALGIEGFTASAEEPAPIRDTRTMRIDVRIDYRGKRWAKIQVEVAPAEGTAGQEVDEIAAPDYPDRLGLSLPRTIPVVSVRYQVAQKLHACTEVLDPPAQNERFQDLIDLQLLEPMIEDLGAVKDACIEVFGLRGQQSWPPPLIVYPSWRAPYRDMAERTGLETLDVEDAAHAVRSLTERISRA